MNFNSSHAAVRPHSSQVAYHVNCNCPLTRNDASGATVCDSLHACSLLESLDDAMFTAITGDPDALAEARRLWTDACAALSPELLLESREQYLRYAADVIREHQAEQVRRPEHMIAAIEVISLLTSLDA